MKFKLLVASAVICGGVMSAQTWSPTANLAFETRIDYQRESVDGDVNHSNSGFKGRFLNIILNGQLNDKFSYSFRHRLNRSIEHGALFQATDWMYLTYSPTRLWDFSVGKQVVAIGGYEYDRAPIDLYFCSEFWNNIPCYQFGVSGAINASSSDKVMFQVCQSPFHTSGYEDSYAYNLIWYGTHGIWSPIWSVNIMEWMPGRYISYIALGNKFTVQRVSLEADYMNRASSHQRFMFADCSLMAELSWAPSNRVRPFAKFTYDVNNTDSPADLCVMPGTEIKTVGAGLEAWALRQGRNEVRLHADVSYAWGRNGNIDAGTLQNKGLMVNCGIKWRIDLLGKK